jgi:hypothetical protein
MLMKRIFCIVVFALLLANLSAAATATAFLQSAMCNDPQGGLGNYNCTQYVNASDTQRANMSLDNTHPAQSYANFTFSIPTNYVVSGATLTLLHQQQQANKMSINISIMANGSAGYTNNVCYFAPLGTSNADTNQTCDLTPYITNGSQASLVRIIFNVTSISSSSKVERFNYMMLNITYAGQATFNGTTNMSYPLNESFFYQYTNFNVNGSYSLNCTGDTGGSCGPVTTYVEYCAGENCTNFARVNATTSIFNVTANGNTACGTMNANSTCSGAFSTTVQAAPGVYELRLKSQAQNSNVTSISYILISVPITSTASSPPKAAICYDPLGGGGTFDCLSRVNQSDNYYATSKVDNTHPGWMQANWTFSVPSYSIIEYLNLSLEHQQSAAGTITVNISVKANGSTTFTQQCSLPPLGSANLDIWNYCNITAATPNSTSLLLVQVLYNITSNAAQNKIESIDYTGLNLSYRVPGLTTNGTEYGDGENVSIRGFSWYNSSNTTISISGTQAISGYPKNVTAAANGDFNDSFALPDGVNGTYNITVTAVTNSLVTLTKPINVTSKGPKVILVYPTPSHGSTLAQSWAYVNASMSKNSSYAYLEWNGTNYSMSGANKNWYLNMTGLADGDYVFKVWANDTINNNWGVSETRSVTIDLTPPSVTNLTATPSEAELYTPAVLSAFVSDPNDISAVIAQVTSPSGNKTNYTMLNLNNLFYHTGVVTSASDIYNTTYRRTDFTGVSLAANYYQACGYIEKFSATNATLLSYACNNYVSGNPNSTSGCSLIGSINPALVTNGVAERCFNISLANVTSSNVSVIWTCPNCTSAGSSTQTYYSGNASGTVLLQTNYYLRTNFIVSGNASSISTTMNMERFGATGVGSRFQIWILNSSELAVWNSSTTAETCVFNANQFSATNYTSISCSDAGVHLGPGNYTIIAGLTKAKVNTGLLMQTSTPPANTSYNSTDAGATWNLVAANFDITLVYYASVNGTGTRATWAMYSTLPLNASETHTFVTNNSGTNWSVANYSGSAVEDYTDFYQRIDITNFWHTFLDTSEFGYYNVTVFANDSVGNMNATAFAQFRRYNPTNLAVWDDTDTVSKIENQTVYFYANYTNAMSGASVVSATCNISFQTPYGWTNATGMSYNVTSQLYYYNRSFNFTGTYDFLVQCSKSNFQPQNATSNYTISFTGAYVTTDQNTYPICSIVFYKVEVYNKNDAFLDANLTVSIYNTTSSLQNTTNVSTGNGGTGIYLGNYTLSNSSDLGKWLITAIAEDTVKGTQNFFVGVSSTKWKIDIDFSPDSIVYLNGTSVTMNFTVWNKDGTRATGLLPGGIFAYIDSTNVTSSLVASGEGYTYPYTASTGSHIVNVSSGNVTSIRGFNVR